jgi:hypothetical protein
MDDITFGGPSAVVADDIELFRSCGSKIGLELNVDKCGVITRQSESTVAFPNFCSTDSTDACLLGAPLFSGQALTTALQEMSAVCDGGLGIRRASSLPLPAHLASAANLQALIL